MRRWTWWQGGIALGLLTVFAMLTYKPVGVSTAYSTTVAMGLRPFVPEFVAGNAYFKTIPTRIEWEWMLVLGIPFGGYLAYRLSRAAAVRASAAAHGKAPLALAKAVTAPVTPTRNGKPVDLLQNRPLNAFAGGFLVLFGARMAGGCTSGHIISGLTQLSVSGFIFAAAVFASALPLAYLLQKRRALA